MAIESIVALALATALLGLITWLDARKRSKDKDKNKDKNKGDKK